MGLEHWEPWVKEGDTGTLKQSEQRVLEGEKQVIQRARVEVEVRK